jgi:HlyD family secretion protein
MRNAAPPAKVREIAIWLVMSFGLAMAACGKKAAPESEPVIPVQVADVRHAAIDRMVTAEGILFPLTQSAVMPKLSAPVNEFFVNRGDQVKKGQLLATLENRDLSAAAAENKGLYKQAEAAYRSTTAASLPEEIDKARLDAQSAQQALEAAEKMYQSRKALLADGAIARRLVDEANVGYVQAKNQHEISQKHLEALQRIGKEAQTHSVEGQLEAAKGRYEGAEAQLQYSQITSPIDGVVADRSVYAGEMASATVPLLVIMDISQVIARASVPVEQLKYVKVGLAATLTGQDGTIYPGRVTVVSPAVDPNSTTAEVWVIADNSRRQLRPGETVRVSIVAERIQNATVVPSAAIVSSKDGSTAVMVVGSDMVAHERRLKLGVRTPDSSQVLDGVNPGETVVIVGALGLQDEAKVRIETAAPHE